VVVLPAPSTAVTVKVLTPTVLVSIGAPLSAVPVQRSTPDPPASVQPNAAVTSSCWTKVAPSAGVTGWTCGSVLSMRTVRSSLALWLPLTSRARASRWVIPSEVTAVVGPVAPKVVVHASVAPLGRWSRCSYPRTPAASVAEVVTVTSARCQPFALAGVAGETETSGAVRSVKS
jgi:hypothetical protein